MQPCCCQAGQVYQQGNTGFYKIDLNDGSCERVTFDLTGKPPEAQGGTYAWNFWGEIPPDSGTPLTIYNKNYFIDYSRGATTIELEDETIYVAVSITNTSNVDGDPGHWNQSEGWFPKLVHLNIETGETTYPSGIGSGSTYESWIFPDGFDPPDTGGYLFVLAGAGVLAYYHDVLWILDAFYNDYNATVQKNYAVGQLVILYFIGTTDCKLVAR